jgi:heat shock protein HtpX
MAASRTREYLADAGGAIFTRNPEALASALEKISGNVRGHRLPLPRAAQPLLIVGASLFSTHPPIDKRVAVLRAMARGGDPSAAAYARSYERIVGGSTRSFPLADLAGATPARLSAQHAPAAAAALATTAATATAPAANASSPFRREALDAVKAGAGYRRLDCVCGATIKVPAAFPRGRSVRCISCGRNLSAG